MELKDFISQTLLDIVSAVESAQKKTTAGTIVPDIQGGDHLIDKRITAFQPIYFEVTVKADESAGSQAKLNVVAAIIGGSIQGNSAKSDGHAATLKFSIPVMLPISKN